MECHDPTCYCNPYRVICPTCKGTGMTEICPVCKLNREAAATKECPEGFHSMKYSEVRYKGIKSGDRYL